MRRPIGFAAIASIVTLLAACGGGGGVTHTLSGTWYLANNNSGGQPCAPDFSNAGTPLEVTQNANGTGKVFGTGTLALDSAKSMGGTVCAYTFKVDSLPTAPSYHIHILNTYSFHFSFTELQTAGWKVVLRSVSHPVGQP